MDQNVPGQALQQNNQQPQVNPDVVGQATQQIAGREQQIQQENTLEQNQQTSLATVSKAYNMLNTQTSDKVSNSMNKVGGALNTNNYSGLCLKYVDDKTGNTDRSPTAYADYQKNAAAGNIHNTGTPPKGARVYFAPTQDNPAGHVMLSNGDGTGTGATTNDGIKTFSIQDWSKYAGQQYIGYSTSGK